MSLPKIHHIKNPRLPSFRFEWHEASKKLYLVRVGTKPEIGEILAFNIEDHGAAINAVLIWGRGFEEGQAPHVVKPRLIA